MKRFLYIFVAAVLAVATNTLLSAQEWPIGISISMFGEKDLASQENLDEVKAAGCDYIEVILNQIIRYAPENEWYARAFELKRRVDDAGLKVWSCHLPHTWEIDISSTDPRVRDYSVRVQEQLIDMCSIFSPKRLCLHASLEPIPETERPERLKNAKNAIGRLSLAAKKIGAVLCIEDLPRTCLGNTSDEIMYLIGDYPGVMCTFDTNHLLKEDHQHFLDVVGPRIAHVHISDYDAIDERHWIEGKGCIDWKIIREGLRRIGYAGVVMHEVRSGENVNPANVVKAYDEVFLKKRQQDVEARELIGMSHGRLFTFNAAKTRRDGTHEKAVTWDWDAGSVATVLGLPKDRMDYIDECKVSRDGNELLITAAHGWCVLLRKEDCKVLFWAKDILNVHSAEFLPGNRIAVACSVGTDCVNVYDRKNPDKVIASYPLYAAHGLYYSQKYKRLFAAGGNKLNIYSLKNWESDTPALELEHSLSTGFYVTDIHDLVPKGEDSLILAGNNAAIFDIKTGIFRSIERFRGIGSIKSINYNPETEEIIYTHSNPDTREGEMPWSTWKIRYSYLYPEMPEFHLHVPEQAFYKVRVYKW